VFILWQSGDGLGFGAYVLAEALSKGPDFFKDSVSFETALFSCLA
jgi:hypothetical protein